VLLDEQGEATAGLPYFHVSDTLGDRIVSLPFSDYADPIVEREQEWNILAEQLLSYDCGVILRSLHNPLPAADCRFKEYKHAMWHGFDLRPSEEELWGGIDPSARRAIRKAEKEGVVVRMAHSVEDLDAFYRLHLRVRKYKYRMLAQPYPFFLNIWKHLLEPGNGFLLLATHAGEVVGGVLFLIWKDTLYYKFNASEQNDLGVRPNDLLLWAGIQEAKARGLSVFDFGLSDWDQEGLLRYKRKYATEEKRIAFLRWKSHCATPASDDLRHVFGQLTLLFTQPDVPDEVTGHAGDVLYRYFT
jgi:hypothetical protein